MVIRTSNDDSLTKTIFSLSSLEVIEKRRLFHIHIPKTGGTSLNRSLSNSELFHNGQHSFCEGGEKVVGGVSIYQRRKVWPSHKCMGLLDSDLIISVVRNPFDWLKSYYFHRGRHWFGFREHRGWQGAVDYHNFRSFEEFILKYCYDDNFIWHCPALKQNPWAQIVTKNGRFLPDIILFQEHLDESIFVISNYLGVSFNDIKIRENLGLAGSDYRKFFTTEAIDAVNFKFKRIFQISNYEFEQRLPKSNPHSLYDLGLYIKGEVY